MLARATGAGAMPALENPGALEGLRSQIDAVDKELVEVVARRFRLAQAVGTLKGAQGAPVLDPRREAEIVRQACREARVQRIPDEGVRDLFWSVLGYCRQAVREPRGGAS